MEVALNVIILHIHVDCVDRSVRCRCAAQTITVSASVVLKAHVGKPSSITEQFTMSMQHMKQLYFGLRSAACVRMVKKVLV